MKKVAIQSILFLMVFGFSCVKSSGNPNQIVFTDGRSWDLYKIENCSQNHRLNCKNVVFETHIDGRHGCFSENSLEGKAHLYALSDEYLPNTLQQIVQNWEKGRETCAMLRNCHSPNNTVTVNIDSSDENKQKIQAYVNANSVNANDNQPTKYRARRPWGGLALLAAVIVAIYFYVKRC